jgi:hypothetical protein
MGLSYLWAINGSAVNAALGLYVNAGIEDIEARVGLPEGDQLIREVLTCVLDEVGVDAVPAGPAELEQAEREFGELGSRLDLALDSGELQRARAVVLASVVRGRPRGSSLPGVVT